MYIEYTEFTPEPCVLRMFGHDGELTCGQSVPKKFRDGLPADKTQWKIDTPKRVQYARFGGEYMYSRTIVRE